MPPESLVNDCTTDFIHRQPDRAVRDTRAMWWLYGHRGAALEVLWDRDCGDWRVRLWVRDGEEWQHWDRMEVLGDGGWVERQGLIRIAAQSAWRALRYRPGPGTSVQRVPAWWYGRRA